MVVVRIFGAGELLKFSLLWTANLLLLFSQSPRMNEVYDLDMDSRPVDGAAGTCIMRADILIVAVCELRSGEDWVSTALWTKLPLASMWLHGTIFGPFG
jgi:hypothetical protein